MKVLAAAVVLVVSVIVIALQLTGWSQTEPKTVNLSSATRASDGPGADSNGVSGPIAPGAHYLWRRRQPNWISVEFCAAFGGAAVRQLAGRDLVFH